YKYATRKFDYWKSRGIAYLPPRPIFGNAFELFTFKPYMNLLKSPDVIKQILIKDFNFFQDRTILAPKHNELIANIMFSEDDANFSPIKLRGMLHLINEISIKMSEYIKENGDKQLESNEVCAKYTTDVIAKMRLWHKCPKF
ncbi:hypothetical protein NQ318_003756, partial [Aromia moschata]